MNIIGIKVGHRFSIITVFNYSTYQDLKSYYGTEVGRKWDASGNKERIKEIEEINKKKKYIKKKKFLEGVYLTEDQYKKLCDQFTETGTNNKIQNLDLYIASTGKKYKCHYSTILAWHRKDEQQQQQKINQPSQLAY
ncbi:MAG: hypothetical protein SCALA701_25680 [Candidatus Scalindua sp.]|nr:MAG: hypothetical protein SCALA701_25680 [Candidatus Scalindua sp.]